MSKKTELENKILNKAKITSFQQSKKIINYPVNYYSCNVVINGRRFVELWVSQYYKAKRGRSTVNDEVIQELVKHLYGKKSKRDENGYFSFDFLYIDHRAYNLVWDYDESSLNTTLLIINCHREKKHDKIKLCLE